MSASDTTTKKAAKAPTKAALGRMIREATVRAESAYASIIDLEAQAGRFWTAVGIEGAFVETLIEQYGDVTGYANVRDWYGEHFPAHTTGVWGSTPAYRSLIAGRVARVIGNVGDASVDALQPLHRIIGEPENLITVWKAAKSRKAQAPTRGDVIAALEKAGHGDATSGPAKGSEAAKAGGRAKAAKNGTRRTAQAPTREVPVPEPDASPSITATRTKAANVAFGRILGEAVATYGDGSALHTLQVIDATLSAVRKYGLDNAEAGFAVLMSDRKAAKASEKAPTRSRTRNRRAKAAKAAA